MENIIETVEGPESVADIVLTLDQQTLIINEWNNNKENPPSIVALCKLCFPNEKGADGRSLWGKAIKKFLAGKSMKFTVPYKHGKREPIILTVEQQDFIENNCISMTAVEMAQELFKNLNINNLSLEARAVNEYKKTIDSKVQYEDPEDIPSEDYKPPNSVDRVIARIKKYTTCTWERLKLTPTQKRNVMSLMGYLHTYRFISQMNSYDLESDRILFESSFVKYTFDKPDLTEEDVDQYIILAIEVVMSFNIQATINMLQKEQDTNIQGGGKISGNLIEAVNVARQEYNASVKRQETLMKNLTTSRSNRMQERKNNTTSILSLIDLWKKEDTRKKLIALAEVKKKKLGEVVDELASMDDLKAKIMGLSKNEVLDG